MTNFDFFITLFAGWSIHAFYAAMRRMNYEITQEKIQRNRDRYTR